MRFGMKLRTRACGDALSSAIPTVSGQNIDAYGAGVGGIPCVSSSRPISAHVWLGSNVRDTALPEITKRVTGGLRSTNFPGESWPYEQNASRAS